MNPLNRALKLIGAQEQASELKITALRQIEEVLDYSGPVFYDMTP